MSIEEIEKKYSDKIESAVKLSKKAVRESDKALKTLTDNIESKIMKDENVLASSISQKVLEGAYKNNLKATLQLTKAINKYGEIKEVILIRVKKVVIEAHTDLRNLRDSLLAEFMTDIEVVATIKTIKHQELAFDNLFQEFLVNYQHLKNNVGVLDNLEQFINSGIASLNSLNKLLYNIDYLNREIPFEDMEAMQEPKGKITFDDEDEDNEKKREKRERKAKRKSKKKV